MKKTVILVLSMVGLLLVSCEPKQNEDMVKSPPKDGSIEVIMTTSHLNDTFDILTSTYKVWNKGKIEKVITTSDTISGLGKIKAESEEDENGNVKTVMVPKDYEFYVTVK